MNKQELITAVAEASEISRAKATIAVNSILDTITNALAEGDKVQLIGFGTFETKKRAARAGKNLRTGETIEIPEARKVAFKSGANLKERVNS